MWFSHWSYHNCLDGGGSGLPQGRSGNGAAGMVSKFPSRCMLAFSCEGRALIVFLVGHFTRWSACTELPLSCLSACMPLFQINCCSFLRALAWCTDLVLTGQENPGAGGFLITELVLYSVRGALVPLFWIFQGQTCVMSGLLCGSLCSGPETPPGMDGRSRHGSSGVGQTPGAAQGISSRHRWEWEKGNGIAAGRQGLEGPKGTHELGESLQVRAKQSGKEGKLCKDTVAGREARFVFLLYFMLLLFRILCSI